MQHASLSFALAAGVGITSDRRATAFGVSLGLGLLKECWDARRTRFDPIDLSADAIGAMLGSLTCRSR
ncbi:MAG: hypothetical protein ABIU54_03725 [Candidatus Eisenbacteria bacterium]